MANSASRPVGSFNKVSRIFHNPDLPVIDDYYEPWTYDYAKLISAPGKKHQPAVHPLSQITGEPMRVQWGPNWEDDLAGVCETGRRDVNFNGLDHAVYLSFKRVFMFYLPRLCEHCLNPACVASCPSGALYKRHEDGIVLVDQERCRGWRYCVSGCPYKKVYFNWKTGRSEKCIFCYPRIEAGLTTLCAHSCVGRIRYVGVVLYDADRIQEAASARSDQEVYPAHLDLFLDPADPETIAAARSQGIPEHVLAAALRSPVYLLAKTWRLALPLHPEFRTLPMVWYIPPLSPVETLRREKGDHGGHRRPPHPGKVSGQPAHGRRRGAGADCPEAAGRGQGLHALGAGGKQAGRSHRGIRRSRPGKHPSDVRSSGHRPARGPVCRAHGLPSGQKPAACHPGLYGIPGVPMTWKRRLP